MRASPRPVVRAPPTWQALEPRAFWPWVLMFCHGCERSEILPGQARPLTGRKKCMFGGVWGCLGELRRGLRRNSIGPGRLCGSFFSVLWCTSAWSRTLLFLSGHVSTCALLAALLTPLMCSLFLCPSSLFCPYSLFLCPSSLLFFSVSRSPVLLSPIIQ